MSFSGSVLKEKNDQIIKHISDLKRQRNELDFLINRQEEEKQKLEAEIKLISHKLILTEKNLVRRKQIRDEYDKSIQDAQENYHDIVESSDALLNTVRRNVEILIERMDKKTGPDEQQEKTLNIIYNNCDENDDSAVKISTLDDQQH